MPAATESVRLSPRSCLRRSARRAPRASRMANSRVRAMPSTPISVAAFAHATTSTEADRAPERDQHRSRGGHELLAERLHADPHVAIRVGVQACQVRRHVSIAARACPMVTLSARRAMTVVLRRPRPAIAPASRPTGKKNSRFLIDDRIADSRRQHANDRARHTINHDGAADDRGIALITSAPRIERDDDDGRRRRRFVAVDEQTTHERRHVQHAEQGRRHVGAEDLLGAGRPRQIEGSPIADGQILERTAVAAPIEIIVVGRATRIRLQ